MPNPPGSALQRVHHPDVGLDNVVPRVELEFGPPGIGVIGISRFLERQISFVVNDQDVLVGFLDDPGPIDCESMVEADGNDQFSDLSGELFHVALCDVVYAQL